MVANLTSLPMSSHLDASYYTQVTCVKYDLNMLVIQTG